MACSISVSNWLLGQVPVSSPFWELEREWDGELSPRPAQLLPHLSSPRAPRSSTLSLPHAQDLLPFTNIGGSLYNPSEARPPFFSPPNSSLLSQTRVSEAMTLREVKQDNRQLGPHERAVLTIPVSEIRDSPQGREGENGRECVRVRERGENIGGRIEAGDPRRPQSWEAC